MRRLRHRRNSVTTELNITAFMNLMVVLVPFLLMTAVFSHLTILELNLPDGSQENSDVSPAFDIQIIIQNDLFIVSDTKGGLIKSIPFDTRAQQYKILRETLKQIKARLPDKTNATILSQPDTSYDTLVQVMDTVRAYPALVDGTTVQAELFPDISIGDAPHTK